MATESEHRYARLSFDGWELRNNVLAPTDDHSRTHRELVAMHANTPFVAIQSRDDDGRVMTSTVHHFILLHLGGPLCNLVTEGRHCRNPSVTVMLPLALSWGVFQHILDFLYCREIRMDQVSSLTAVAVASHQFDIMPLFRACCHSLFTRRATEMTYLSEPPIREIKRVLSAHRSAHDARRVVHHSYTALNCDGQPLQSRAIPASDLVCESILWYILWKNDMLLTALRQILCYCEIDCCRAVLTILSVFVSDYNSRKLRSVIQKMRDGRRREECIEYLNSHLSLECSPRVYDLAWEIAKAPLPLGDALRTLNITALVSRSPYACTVLNRRPRNNDSFANDEDTEGSETSK